MAFQQLFTTVPMNARGLWRQREGKLTLRSSRVWNSTVSHYSYCQWNREGSVPDHWLKPPHPAGFRVGHQYDHQLLAWISDDTRDFLLTTNSAATRGFGREAEDDSKCFFLFLKPVPELWPDWVNGKKWQKPSMSAPVSLSITHITLIKCLGVPSLY